MTYIDGFTLHGLSKSCVGKLWERIFWFVCLTIALCYTIYMCHLYFVHYRKTDIRTEVRILEKDIIPMPSITFCLHLFDQYHCHKNKTVAPFSTTEEQKQLDAYCYDKSKPHLKIDCMDHKCKPKYIYPGCVTLNFDGNMKSYYHFQRISVECLEHDAANLRVYLDTPEDVNKTKDVLIFKPSNSAQVNASYEFQMDLQLTSRLPAPYTSNCSDGASIENFFSTKYSRYSCLETCWARQMLDECGTVIDRWKPHVPKHFLNGKNLKSDAETRKCLYAQLGEIGVPEWCKCPVPCQETDFGATFIRQSRLNPGDIIEHGWLFKFRFKTHKITYVTEVPEYPFESFISEVGGLVGLLVGMSALSIMEILVFSAITIIGIVTKFKKKL